MWSTELFHSDPQKKQRELEFLYNTICEWWWFRRTVLKHHGIDIKYYQNLLAFVFAVTEINKNPRLLPNITLGFHIVDPCLAEAMATSGMINIMTGKGLPIPNYRCGLSPNLVAVVDGVSSKVTLLIARVFGIYKLPQITYASMDPVLSDKNQFPSFYRTVPNEIAQYDALIHKYIKQVSITDGDGNELHFDENGDMPSDFDILNWIVYPNQTLDGIKTPRTPCSETCLIGFRKKPKEGYPECCNDCAPCPEGEISNQTGEYRETCFKCPINQWPNLNRTICTDKVIIHLSFHQPLGASLALLSVLFFIMTCLVLMIFTKYRNTAVVKANNRDLSYILLVSLKICFLCNLMFIGHPRHVTCILRQTVFGVIFSIVISSVLAKTVTVVIAFNATRPGSKLRNYLGPRVPNSIVIFCSLTQVIICTSGLINSPPFPYYNTDDIVGVIVAECHEHSSFGFYCILGFMGLLAALCFIIAFFARTLPDIFNEAKFITFSMLLFCSVWVTFIPAYLSTKGKYVVAVEIFAILSSSSGILGCIFIPKCYIILFRIDKNKTDFKKKNSD
ncbi:vomeronasal type-2 receptor 26 [Xenopus tropicalis]|uniref:Vomeronasal type-2 receptor 26 n=1 Tax=Xenopus tropicalis TaxID=8364 RepID=A0A8J1IPP6_XENTR|nr:vomeronasal type-2 receptor 26 [Xenopus tropicalis]